MLREIGQKSVNDFTESDIENSQKWAHKFYNELGTKSPFFRAWFGDWRAEENNPAPYISDVANLEIPTAAEASKLISNGLKFRNLFRGKVINNDTNYEITIGSQVYNDTLTYASRMFSRDKNVKHYNSRLSLLQKIREISKNAVLLDTVNIKKDESNLDSTFIHKFYCTAKVNDDYYIVKLTVDEFNSKEGTIRRAYNVNNIEISPIAVSQVYSPAGAKGDIGEFLSTYSISDLHRFVKQLTKNFLPNL